jgi:hypothetical protein
VTTFTFDGFVPSVRLKKSLLQDLEAFIAQRVAEICQTTPEAAKRALKVKIEDGLGLSTLDSVEQFLPDRFLSGTKGITIEVFTHSAKPAPDLLMSLTFHADRDRSRWRITITADSSRELVTTLREGILQLLEPHMTWHWMVNPSSVVGAIFVMILSTTVMVVAVAAIEPIYTAWLVWLLIFLSMLALPWLRPYVLFDSRTTDQLDSAWRWAIGLITPIILGAATVPLIRRALGL